jgi:hypothetical protein
MEAPKKTEITRLKWYGDKQPQPNWQANLKRNWFSLESWDKKFVEFKAKDTTYDEIITIRDLDFFLELHKAMTAAITEMERIHNLNK